MHYVVASKHQYHQLLRDRFLPTSTPKTPSPSFHPIWQQHSKPSGKKTQKSTKPHLREASGRAIRVALVKTWICDRRGSFLGGLRLNGQAPGPGGGVSLSLRVFGSRCSLHWRYGARQRECSHARTNKKNKLLCKETLIKTPPAIQVKLLKTPFHEQQVLSPRVRISKILCSSPSRSNDTMEFKIFLIPPRRLVGVLGAPHWHRAAAPRHPTPAVALEADRARALRAPPDVDLQKLGRALRASEVRSRRKEAAGARRIGELVR